MKIRPLGDEMLHADRQTVNTKLTITYRSFANAPKNCLLWPISGYYDATGVTKVRASVGWTAGKVTEPSDHVPADYNRAPLKLHQLGQ